MRVSNKSQNFHKEAENEEELEFKVKNNYRFNKVDHFASFNHKRSSKIKNLLNFVFFFKKKVS